MSNARFSILQALAVKDRRISDAQFRTLAALGMYADENGWCFPFLKTLGADLKKSKQAVGRDTIALKKLGYLEVKNRYDKKTKSRHSNLYRLRFDLPDVAPHVDTPSTSEVDTLSTPEVDVNVPLNDPINKRSITEKMPIDWLIKGGASKDELQRLHDKEVAQKDITDHYERKMKYNPLPWDSDKDLESLRRFLMTKTKDEIDQFAEWSQRDFSSLSPAKARQKPRLVIECWPQAVQEKIVDPRTSRTWKDGKFVE